MARKDLSDAQVVQAQLDAQEGHFKRFAYDLLAERTGEPHKVCLRAMERAADRGYLDYGVSLRTAWVTEEGLKLLADTRPVA